MTKRMIKVKFSELLQLMALIQPDIENSLFEKRQTTSAMSKTKGSAISTPPVLRADARIYRLPFMLTKAYLSLMNQKPGRPKKNSPYAAELRGGTIHPVVRQLVAWRQRNGLSQRQAVAALQRYNFPITQSGLRNWEEGRNSPRAHTVAILAQLLAELADKNEKPKGLK